MQCDFTTWGAWKNWQSGRHCEVTAAMHRRGTARAVKWNKILHEYHTWLQGRRLKLWWLSIRMLSSDDKESLKLFLISWTLIPVKKTTFCLKPLTQFLHQGGNSPQATSRGRNFQLTGPRGPVYERNTESNHIFTHIWWVYESFFNFFMVLTRSSF